MFLGTQRKYPKTLTLLLGEGGFLRKKPTSGSLLGTSSCSCIQPLPQFDLQPLRPCLVSLAQTPTADLSPTRRLSCDLAAPWTEPEGLRGQAMCPVYPPCSVWQAALSSVQTSERAMAAGSIWSHMLSLFKTKFLFHGFIIHVCIWGRSIVPWSMCG